MDPKDVHICYDFVQLFLEQKKQKNSITYCSVIGYLLENSLGSVESRLSSKNPLQIFSDLIPCNALSI